jgi:hypothetical protein
MSPPACAGVKGSVAERDARKQESISTERSYVNRAHFAHRYTGTRVQPFAPPHHFAPMAHSGPGTCRSCGHPSAQCQCGCRECRKESKELLVESRDASDGLTSFMDQASAQPLAALASADAKAAVGKAVSSARSFIGGGCCVHVSIEYAPVTPTAKALVAVIVVDTEGTTLAWLKVAQPGTQYQVKESVVTTKPGATITLFAVNATARIRWCEVFSC